MERRKTSSYADYPIIQIRLHLRNQLILLFFAIGCVLLGCGLFISQADIFYLHVSTQDNGENLKNVFLNIHSNTQLYTTMHAAMLSFYTQ